MAKINEALVYNIFRTHNQIKYTYGPRIDEMNMNSMKYNIL